MSLGIAELCQWMADNWLIFNDEKTEFMILCSRFSDPATFPILHILVMNVFLFNTARNLGFTLTLE